MCAFVCFLGAVFICCCGRCDFWLCSCACLLLFVVCSMMFVLCDCSVLMLLFIGDCIFMSCMCDV